MKKENKEIQSFNRGIDVPKLIELDEPALEQIQGGASESSEAHCPINNICGVHCTVRL